MKNYTFTIVIIAAVATALTFPQYFIEINGFPLKNLIIPLLQVIMFGMGATMSWQDFANVARMPKAVLVGLICQFTIMPGVGFTLATLFPFPPEVAAGIILIGCSPSGLASNVMAYIAKANVALSVTITACATLMAPFLTPLLMRWLGGQFIEVSVSAMMLDIIKMIIAPIALGLLVNYVAPALIRKFNRFLPLISMAGIVMIVMIITALGAAALMRVGLLLFAAVLLHNLFGYLLGYWGARFAGLDEKDCRTVAIEVGLQNAGLASGLALQMGKGAGVALAAGLFGPVMNTTGSILAGWWSKRPD